MSYLSVGSDAQRVQLTVEELVVQITDTAIVTTSASTITIDCQQTVTFVVEALFVDDSAGTVAPVSVANTTISGTTVKLTLTAPFATGDSVRLCFKTTKS